MKKIFMAVLCLSLFAVFYPGIAYGTDEAIDKCIEQLLQKYPNVEAIKTQFGSEAEWQERTMPSIHDPDLELQITDMIHPGIEITTLGYTHGGEHSFLITKMHPKKAGIVDFLAVDVGSARDDVIKAFGEPQKIDENMLIYHSESEYVYIRFTIENNVVAEMRYNSYPD